MFFTLIKWWSKNRLAYAAFFSVTFYCTVSDAQVIQTQRYETPLSELEQGFEIAPAGNIGIYLYRGRIVNARIALEIVFLDTTLQQKWHGYLPIQQHFVVAKQYFYDSTLYLILRYGDRSKNDLQIIAIHPSKGNFIQYSIQNFIPLNLTDFQVTKRAALIGGYYNNIPVVIYYDLATLKSKIVPGLFNEQGELTQIKTYPDGSFDVLVSSKGLIKKKSIVVRNYDGDGILTKNVLLRPDDDKNLIFGRSIKTSNNREIIAGTYSNFIADISKGIFTANIDPAGTQQIQYYNYGDLHNFFHYLSARHEARIRSRIARRKIKGRKLRFNYRLLVHELIPYHGQYILLGEAFYPHYTYTNPGYGYGSVYSARYAVFDGYYYTHAVIIGLDRNGKLLWDNSFEISDVRTFTLDQFVKIDAQPNKITLLYLFNNKIRSKIIMGDSVLEDKASESIKLNTNEEAVRKNDISISKLEHWYQHYFIAYGTQRITNNRDEVKRRVFFINKVIPK